jgi:hypothetical protein
LFINNTASVVLPSLILPRVSRSLGWWLSLADHDGKHDLAGVALVTVVFWQYQIRFGLPF